MLSLSKILTVFKNKKKLLLSFGMKLVNAFFNFIVVFFLINQYEPSITDKYFLYFSVCMVASTFLRVGADNLIVREVGKYSLLGRKSIPVSLKNILLVIFFMHFLFLISVVLVNFYFNFLNSVFYILIVCTYLFSVNIVISYIFQGLSRINYSILCNLLVPNIIFVTVNSLFHVSNVENILIIYSLSLSISIICSLYILYRYEINFSQDVVQGPRLDSYANFGLMTIIGQVMIWSPQLFLSMNANELEVSAFSIFQRLSLSICFVLTAINYIYAPIYAKLYSSNDIPSLVILSKKTSFIMIIVSSPCFLLIALFNDHLLNAINPDLYKYKFEFLMICFSQLVNVIAGSVGYILNMSNKEKYVRNVMICVLITYLIFSLILVPQFGFTASVWIYSGVVVFQNIILLIVMKKMMGFVPVVDVRSIKTIFMKSNE